MKASSANIQVPEKRQAPNFKRAFARLPWCLEFDPATAGLELGAWNLKI
jgi:hypothetical protein